MEQREYFKIEELPAEQQEVVRKLWAEGKPVYAHKRKYWSIVTERKPHYLPVREV